MKRHQEIQYLNLLKQILEEGIETHDRTGIGTKSIFGTRLEFDISKEFPLLTTKYVWFKGIVHELLWFISGSTNVKYLLDNDVRIWDNWCDKDGEVGPSYGKQMRDCGGVDQLDEVIKSLKESPYSRRHIISLWNPPDISKTILPPCHGTVIQFYVGNDNKLSCQMYQRSNDEPIGKPFNIASYALFTYMIAQVTNLEPGKLIIVGGDSHIYLNQIEAVKEQLKRDPYPLPTVELNPHIKNINDFKYNDFKLVNYKHHPKISMKIAV